MFIRHVCFLALPFGIVGDTLATKDPDLDDEEEETHVYEKHDKLLHGDRKERKSVQCFCIFFCFGDAIILAFVCAPLGRTV